MRARSRPTTPSWATPARALEHSLFIVIPVALTVLFLVNWATDDVLAVDFHHYYWPAGDRVLHGLSPYVHGPWYPSEVPVGFVYPAPAAVVFAAIAAIPREIGDVIFTALALGSPLMTLRLLEVRDWRPYGVVLLWPPIVFGFQTANLSMIVTVAVAAMWRYRDRARVAGVLLGVVVALKLFLVPLGLFFLATRRFGAVGYGIATAVGVSAVAWMVIGIDQFEVYRATVREFTSLREDYGYSIVGFVERLGGGRLLAYATALALGGAAAAASATLALRGRESASFVLAISASLLVTPIMWLHYLVLLLVPVGLRCPRLHVLWALPLLLFLLIIDGKLVGPTTLQVAAALSLAALTIAVALRRPDRSAAVAAPAPSA